MNSFSIKLNKLMELENITNTKLAKAINVDASLISRWRNGKRQINKNACYVEDISKYFAVRATAEYKKIALLQFMGIPVSKDLENEKYIEKEMIKWLKNDKNMEYDAMEGFFSKISNMGSEDDIENIRNMNSHVISSNTKIAEALDCQKIYVGNKGKRAATLVFLTEILKSNTKTPLLLYSDEDINWLIEDSEFIKVWNILLIKILMKGHKIKIIHTVNRNVQEMIYAIEKWLPLYMVGDIEPYYYPKYREDVFKKTMFVAPNIIAVNSQSVDNISGTTVIIDEQSALENQVILFNNYIKKCRSLMKIFKGQDIINGFHIRNEFYAQEGDTLYKSSSLSLDTIPIKLLEDILTEENILESDKELILNAQEVQNTAFIKNIENNKYSEFIYIPETSEIEAGKVIISHSNMMFGRPIYYKREQYIGHLKNIIMLLNKYKNYNVYILQDRWPSIHLAVKNEVGVIISKNDNSPALFAFNHINMTEGMYYYLEMEMERLSNLDKDKNHVIMKLQDIIEGV